MPALGFAPGSIGVAAIPSPRRRRRVGRGDRRGGVVSRESERFQGAANRVDLGLGVGQFVDRRDLTQRQRLEGEFGVRERLYPVRPGEMRIFGSQETDRVLLL